MYRILLCGTVVACGLAYSVSHLKSASITVAASARIQTMQFEMRREGPADLCGDKCKTWVSASGAITADTLADFEAFAKKKDLRGVTIAFDSVGGSVIGALALGRAIRRFEMITMVGRTVVSGRGKDARVSLSANASCESMCAFVLLAGVQRYVAPEARVLVHQIWLGDRRDDAVAANYSAEDLMIVQRDIGRLAQFTVEMGGTIDLLEMALRIPPWEPMRSLSYDEIRRMRLSTVAAAFEQSTPDPVPQVTTSTALQPTRIAARGSEISERSWSLVEQGGTATLARRHPMTVEGEELGTFDILFGCGDGPDSYAVSYIDRRGFSDAHEHVRSLREVTLSIGQRNVALKVLRSAEGAPIEPGAEIAAGTAPASFVKALADGGSRTLTVVAATAEGVDTVIRVGNTGFSNALPQLASVCTKQTRSRSVRAELAR